jgi:two-component system OmpR family sensor kinase
MAVLLLLFSTILYNYITYSVDKELESMLVKHAKYLFTTHPDVNEALSKHGDSLKQTLNIEAKIIYFPKSQYQPMHIRKYKKKDKYFIELLFPYNFQNQTYLSVSSNVTEQKKVQQHVYNAMIFINLIGMGIIILYAYFLSGVMTRHIRVLAQKLSKRNENMMKPINAYEFPQEFEPLAASVNALIMRIQNFIKYKKELFIGAAHELKTPLAVMKTKTQVTLMKKKITEEDLKTALRQNIISIDEMDKIISSILEFGRAEGAQFEIPQDIDVIAFLREKANDYRLLADSKKQNFITDLQPVSYVIHLQPMLLTHIVQNFIQNAFKFTPSGKTIWLKSYPQDTLLIIEVIDEGSGIDEQKDLFAPFERTKNSGGVGLGLFLAKSAANAMGASLELVNRSDGQGTIARLILQKRPYCKL